MVSKKMMTFFFFFYLFTFTSLAHLNTNRADGHAPLGVMGDHTHNKGEWMLSYRYMRMAMSDNLNGTSKTSKEEIHSDFMVAPLEMDMDMHMFGVMHAINDDLTLMGMLPYLELSMELENRMANRFTTQSRGIGDIKLTALYNIFVQAGHKVHLNLGFSSPTGSITKRDDTPAGSNQKLAYPMQIGSGTFDLLPGLTYLGMKSDYSWGAQISGVLRLGRNDEGYSLGDRLEFTAWASRKWLDWISSSVRLKYENSANVDGEDSDLNSSMLPSARNDLQGAQRVNVLVGLNLYGSKGWKKAHRLALEIGSPVHEDLDGPRLSTDWLLLAGWQYTW